jgi:probable lipoprotein NlpC
VDIEDKERYIMSVFNFFQKNVLYLVFFILMQTLAFALPPIRTEQPDTARSQLIKEAEKYLGVPYRYGGMTASGLDCSGLVCLVFKDALNVSTPRTAETFFAWAEKINTADLQIGDLVFFNTTGKISHLGIYAGNNKFIHSASDGPKTGVMISSLDESYWKRTYVSAGRALSESIGSARPVLASANISAEKNSTYEADSPQAPSTGNNSPFIFSLGGALSWNNYIYENDVIRGAGFQIGAAYPLSFAGINFSFGLELRPEWDMRLGVFRLPITLSFGTDMLRAFLGPALSFGDSILNVPEGLRYFDGGTSWIGEAGITFAPFTFHLNGGKFAFYGEFAWQFYYPQENQIANELADFSAATRISTGFRYIFQN